MNKSKLDPNDMTRIDLRLTVREKNRIVLLAKHYADGNITEFIKRQTLKANPVVLEKKQTRDSSRA